MAYKLEILPRDEKDKEKRKRQIVENPKGCIVLVHGICHGAWCWDKFINFFADEKYQCYAVSLRGHGNSEGREDLNKFGLSDYVEDVRTAVEVCSEETGMKPFLIGHSMGGAVVQQYIGKYEATVQGAVLFAPATAPEMSLWDVIPKEKNSMFATLIAWDRCGILKVFGKSREDIVHHAAFFTGEDRDGKRIQRVKDTSYYSSQLQAESKKITGGIMPAKELRRCYSDNYHVQIPVFVIGSDADLYFKSKKLIKTATKYCQNGKTALVILRHLCHDMMLDDDEWETSAVYVLKFIEDSDTFVGDEENHWPRKKI